LAGKEYRLRSDSSEESLQQVASYVDQSMQKIRERTDTVDSLDTALLTALNLAREVLHLRNLNAGSRGAKNEGNDGASRDRVEEVPDGRLRVLIEQIESALPAADSVRP
jgi:cell division protein ZapA (FtsZ GTPase activity inhibitor)